MITSKQTAHTLLLWIKSCYTYQQLTTCEKLIDSMLIERYPDEYIGNYVTYLSGVIQIRSVELAMIPPQIEGHIKWTLCARRIHSQNNNKNSEQCN